MRTFKVLLAGWLLGGLVIVALSVGAFARDQAGPHPASGHPLPQAGEGQVTSFVRETMPQADEGLGLLRIPVLGITRDALKDTFLEARGGGRIHRAIDILAPRGTPVVAVVDGEVRKLFNSRAGGLTLYLFDNSEQRSYYYAHLDRYADGLVEGARVGEGTVLGYVGTTGNAPPGTPHLHFAVEVLPPTKEWWKGEAVNPYPLLTRPASALR